MWKFIKGNAGFFASLILLIVAGLVLTACGATTPKVEVREVTIYKYILPPDDLILNCDADAPPFTPEEYAGLDPDRKEKELFGYSNILITSIIICNKRMDGIRVWKVQKLKAQAADELKAQSERQ